VSVAGELLSNYQHQITALHLVTGNQGVFDVRVDGDLIYSKDETGRHGEPGEMVDVVRGVLEA
jgi:selenoprotein W-related protein